MFIECKSRTVAVEELNVYKSPSTDQIPAEVIRAAGKYIVF